MVKRYYKRQRKSLHNDKELSSSQDKAILNACGSNKIFKTHEEKFDVTAKEDRRIYDYSPRFQHPSYNN